MLRPEAVQIFLRVAELASFTRAADALNLPKASISTAVQQLESQLGTRLLNRTTRKVQLTQDGRAFYDRGKDLLADLDELGSMFQQRAEALRGRLRVDMPSGVARHLVLPKLPEFLRRHPQLEIEISSTDRKVDVIREGFDCVMRVGSLDDPSLVARALGSFRLVNCVSPSYIAEHGAPRELADLDSHLLIHYALNFGSPSSGFEYFDGTRYRTVSMRGRVTVNSAEGYQAACLAGLGIIQAPVHGVAHLIRQGQLVEVLPQLRAEPMPVALVYAHRRNLSRRVRAFMEWVGEAMRDYL